MELVIEPVRVKVTIFNVLVVPAGSEPLKGTESDEAVTSTALVVIPLSEASVSPSRLVIFTVPSPEIDSPFNIVAVPVTIVLALTDRLLPKLVVLPRVIT